MSGNHDTRGPDDAAEPRAEREFDDVRRAYAALGEEPVPPLLDARVLARAREAVRPTRTRPRWLVPASLAATVLVAFGIALDVRREASRTDAYDVVPAPDAPASDAAPAANAPAAPLEAPATAPAPSAGFGVARESARADRAANAQSRASESAGASEGAATAEPAAKAAPATEAVLAPAPPPAAASARARSPASEKAIAMPEQAAPASVEQRQDAAPLPPEEWLAKIDALRRQGRTAEADAELARFRRAYPDYAPR